MATAVAAALAALLTVFAFVAPDLFGSVLALAVGAAACRLGTLLLLRRATAAEDTAQQGAFRLLFLGEALFAAALVAGLPVEPYFGGGSSAWIGWAGLAAWLAYGAAGAWGGLKLLAAAGWLRAGGILIAVAAGFWFTWIGLLLWPFAMAAGYGCFAVARMKLYFKTKD
ncbi:MAG: hypothetical protein OXC10_11380 [Rhodospirillaceae bacterium]|nr:hypothetical protein [Rhodospirillaceae bacterium]